MQKNFVIEVSVNGRIIKRTNRVCASQVQATKRYAMKKKKAGLLNKNVRIRAARIPRSARVRRQE